MTRLNESRTERDVIITRILDAPIETVWKAWVETEMVKKWWGPKGFSVPVAEMDFREGGVSLISMEAPQEMGGSVIYNAWTYTRILTNQRIEFILKFTDKDRNILNPADIGIPAGVPKEVPHVITFRDIGGKTEVTYKESGYATNGAVETSRAGLNEVLVKLAEALK
jgi:uncharacterized protein YndB with AHSA1/START domain